MGRFLANMAQKATQSIHAILEQSGGYPDNSCLLHPSYSFTGLLFDALGPCSRTWTSTQTGGSSAAAPCCAYLQRYVWLPYSEVGGIRVAMCLKDARILSEFMLQLLVVIRPMRLLSPTKQQYNKIPHGVSQLPNL